MKRFQVALHTVILCSLSVHGQLDITRAMYDSISNMMGEKVYPEAMWKERVDCFDKISPNLNIAMEKAWEGMIRYWDLRGQEADPWLPCEKEERWFESNCTSQTGVQMDIWEPCNFASNLAYDR